MQPVSPEEKPNPPQKANVCSRLFSWVCTAHLSGALSAVRQHPWGPTEHPVVKAHLPLRPSLFPCGGHAVLHCALFLIAGNDVPALSVGGATAGCRSDCPALDGNNNVMSCRDDSSHSSSAFAKLLRDVIFITPNFLLLDEIPEVNTQLPSDGEVMVDMQDFTAFWDEESETPTLQGLSFTVRPGERLAVVGPVGAGKSSLLSALLGELPPSQGKVSMLGRIAYVSQLPWVFPGTVKSNILFGKKYEEERYEEVIKACALKEDLQLLEDRDLTVTGDGGTPSSEEQKARISLVRAMYQDADIYLLDDPLSAVDVGVSRHLFEQSLCARYVWEPVRQEDKALPSRGSWSYGEDVTKKTESIQVTLPLEDHLEGKVGFKTYENYFTAGADWPVIIFLILVNIAAQVAIWGVGLGADLSRKDRLRVLEPSPPPSR
ncbi:unnamed protein product [Rangifer tarandus platyrhynchus]|uniref:Uncharacterized protein n=1 Tax=Rangifer tarandus platyrhynchus TaxID=3082113 RepID=A0AC60A747_RANTA